MKSLIITWITLLLIYKTYKKIAKWAIDSIEREEEDGSLRDQEETGD